MEPTTEEKKILLETARQSINSIFTNEKMTVPDFAEHPIFNSHCGAFVTLTQDRILRGCIGYIISDIPLFQTIREAAVHAAVDDPRFLPVKQKEIELISIEISILSEPFALNNYDEIEIGKHGLILEENGRRGLLLPQVPIEHKMNRDQFLDALCQKAGLHGKYWKTKQLNLSAFTATVFNEENINA
jgi:hypothetical protein